MITEELDPFLQQAISDLQARMDKVGLFHKAAVVGVTAWKIEEDGPPKPEVIIIDRTPFRSRRLRHAFMRASTWVIQKVIFRVLPAAWLMHDAEMLPRFESEERDPLKIIDVERPSPGGGEGNRDGAQLYISAGTDEEGD